MPPRSPLIKPPHRLTVVQVSMIAIVVLVLFVHLMALPVRYRQLSTVSSTAETAVGQLQPGDVTAFTQVGIPVELYAAYFTVLEAIVNLFFIGAAFLIIWGRPYDQMALFVAVTLLLLALFLPIVPALATGAALGQRPILFLRALTAASSIPLFYLFPDGRFAPRWLRWPTLIWLIYVATWLKLPALRPPYAYGGALTPPQMIAVVWVFIWLGSGVWSQIYRYRYSATALQKQQTKWVVYGFAVTIVLSMGGIALLVATTTRQGDQLDLMARFLGPTLILLGALQIPMTISIAILRYRLFDIDLIINRTLVYSALTALVIGAYALVISTFSILLPWSGHWFISLAATGLVAVLFQPLRERVQRAVNRLLYGERDEPYTVLARFGQRLEATLAPEAILPTIAETVGQALKLPYTAVALKEGERFATRAEYRRVGDKPSMAHEQLVTRPLLYQTETIGQLIIAPRAAGETFTTAEQRLLDDIAHQAGIAVHAVRLTTDLQRSREHLVAAREEERRRLRRDLHDGLGPALAALLLKVDATREVVRDPVTSDTLLLELKGHIQQAIADIRRLVYNLRPPALDEFGLVGAIQEYLLQLNGAETLEVRLDAPTLLPPLSAAVEVAAYRIVQEALTNVVRHAQACHCRVHVTLTEGALHLEISDDGMGLSAGWHAGVGITAMRERVAELSGVYVIEALPAGGTCVLAQLPLVKG